MRRQIRQPFDASIDATTTRRHRHSGLYLRHHRQAQRRDDQPWQPDVFRLLPGCATGRFSPLMISFAFCRCATFWNAYSLSTHRSLPRPRSTFAESPETIFDNLQEVSPQTFVAVPRLWEKIYSQVALRRRRRVRHAKMGLRPSAESGWRARGLSS